LVRENETLFYNVTIYLGGMFCCVAEWSFCV